jgi:hypothetical protein
MSSNMSEPLTPRKVSFYGDDLIAVEHDDGTIYTLFTRLCENLGLRREAQVRRALRHTVLREGLITLTIQTAGGPQAAQFLRLDLLPLWLSGVQSERVKEEIREQLTRYQREAAQALWQAFRHQIVVEETAAPTTDPLAIQQLQQIAEMGRAIVAMAEQQIEIQRQQQALNTRLDRAGHVVRGMQQQIGDIHVRLGELEERVHPSAFITEAQANEVSLKVKALAEALTSKDTTKNHYQGIFGELYRRFQVASYKLIRHDQYATVIAFLDDWGLAAARGEIAPEA